MINTRLAVVLTSLVGALLLAATGCSSGAAQAEGTGGVELRLGYFPNLTHAGAIVGVDRGFFAEALGTNVRLSTRSFNAGPAATEAFFAGEIDATFIGPNPTINGFAKSKGQALRVISGATSGGAALVVRAGISTPEDLRGKKVATPQLGNTQDVALRYWLKQHGLRTDTKGGGDVAILPQENSQTLQTFGSGQIDGAWVPEPWATRLVQEAKGTILVDEATLWPGGRFVTTNLIVSTAFLTAHPDVVQRLLTGLVKATDWINANPADAQKVVNAGIEKLTGKPLKDATIAAAWKNLTFTVDPIAASLRESATHAQAVGLLEPVDLTTLYDLAPLNRALTAAGKPEIKE